MTRIKVCGVDILARDVRSHGGGHIYPGARDIASTAKVSVATARRLAASVGRRPPRPGYELNLCASTWLENSAGRFVVRRMASRGFSGRRR